MSRRDIAGWLANTFSRRWLMGLVAATIIPAMFIVILELGLRVAGTGHPTSFFVERAVSGERYLFTNHQFTFRFFPKALARSVLPYKMQATKPDGVYRIFIFGESAAIGDPDPAYSFGRHLEILLDERFPETDFEIVTTAITAINSHVILPIARDVARREADLWIIYMGNNEMIGPYGASTIFGSKAPPLELVRASIAAKGTRIGQLMTNLSEGMQIDSASPEAWGGINMFKDNLLHSDDPVRRRVYRNFRDNLEDILAAGRKAGVPVLLSTVASNLRDCGPFASLHREGLASSDLKEWEGNFEQGKQLEAAASYAEALRHYEAAAAIDGDYAELQFRIGRCHGLTGNLEAAARAMQRARDADGLAVRTDSRLNGIIREAASGRDHDSIHLVDSEALLAAQSPGGIPGREFFYEHVHFTLQGNHVMARILGDGMLPLLPAAIREQDTGSWVEAGTCQRRMAATLWEKERLWSEMFERQSSPPFDARPFNDYSLANCQNAAAMFRERINARFDRLLYESALEEDPEDYHLHQRFGNYLLLNGDIPGAIEHFRWITETFPEFEGGHQELGLALFLVKRHDEARESFERVLEINPDYGKARKALALIEEQAP